MNENTNQCMDWDDAIESDGREYVLLDEGDYNFTVTSLERGRFPGSLKMSPCNKAALTLAVETPEGTVNVLTDLILNRLVEWRISSFFRSIGQKKHGERLVPNWSRVVGSRGRAHFKPREAKTADGEKYFNDVDRFYDYDEKYFSAPAPVDIFDDDLPF